MLGREARNPEDGNAIHRPTWIRKPHVAALPLHLPPHPSPSTCPPCSLLNGCLAPSPACCSSGTSATGHCSLPGLTLPLFPRAIPAAPREHMGKGRTRSPAPSKHCRGSDFPPEIENWPNKLFCCYSLLQLKISRLLCGEVRMGAKRAGGAHGIEGLF